MDESSSLLSHQAIMAALSGSWEEALRLNQEIIDADPKNVEALNRIARAYFELGDLTKAKKYFDTALSVDPYNQIAAKFLKRIKTFSKGAKTQSNPQSAFNPLSGDLFIQEPGKTKVVTLLKVAEPQKLSLLSSGMIVNLIIKNHSIAITDQSEEYLGVLPDDLSHHLIRLIHGGNKYQALIKTIKTNSLSVLIREAYRCPRFRNQPSFLDEHSETMTYGTDHLVVSPDEIDEEVAFESDEEDAS